MLRRARLVGGREVNPLAAFRALSTLRKIVVALVIAGLLLWAYFFVRDLFTGAARTEARLGTGQADAALQSGKDAATTVGQQAETEAARERSVAEMQKDVNDADNASDAHAAGAGWLCNDFGICSEE